MDDDMILGRNQFGLLRDALAGLLGQLVEDWTADAPIAKDPWEGAGILGKSSGTGDVWNAINQARAVLAASERWVTDNASRSSAPAMHVEAGQ